MKRINLVSRLVYKFNDLFKKKPKQAYEEVPFRTRVRMYLKGCLDRSHNKISYRSLRKRVGEKFKVDLLDLKIYPEELEKLKDVSRVEINATDLWYEKKR